MSNQVSPMVGNILQSIYGPGYGNLLNTNAYTGPVANFGDIANLVSADAYAQAVNSRAQIINYNTQTLARLNWQQQAAQRVLGTTAGSIGGMGSAGIQAQNQLINIGQQYPQAYQTQQYAALAPVNAPQMVSPQSQTVNRWNPYSGSGWVSPMQSGLGMPNFGGISNRLLSYGA
jgi:hypothetical protein